MSAASIALVALCVACVLLVLVVEVWQQLMLSRADLLCEVEERRLTEHRLTRSKHLYAALSATNQAIVHTKDRDELLRTVCRTAVVNGGLRSALIALLSPETDELASIASAGGDLGAAVCADSCESAFLNTTTGPANEATRTGTPIIRNDLAAVIDAGLSPERLRREGVRSAAFFPLQLLGRPAGVMCVYAAEADFFDEELVELLAEMAGDVSFALGNFEMERQRVATEQALRLRQRAIEASANAVIIAKATDPSLPVEYVNAAYEQITGFSEAEVVGMPSPLFNPYLDDDASVGALRAALRDKRDARAIVRSRHKDGRFIWTDIVIAPVADDHGHVTHYVGVVHDVTKAKAYEDRLLHQANHDALTGLSNRYHLRTRLEQSLGMARVGHGTVAVAEIDIDQFKSINDSHGHAVGDELLTVVAQRLLSSVRPEDTVARTGGDEFVLVLPQSHGSGDPRPADAARRVDAEVMAVLERVQAAFAMPVNVAGRSLSISCSAGVSLFPTDATDANDLLRKADAAMYEAKSQGRARIQFYSAALEARTARRVAIEAGLREAMQRDELRLNYQPKVSLVNGQIVGAEALLRWTSQDIGPVSPSEFIPVAEQTGLIVAIGGWVMRSACHQLAMWRKCGLPRLALAVNVSPCQLSSATFVDDVSSLMKQFAVEPGTLEFELTETAVMNDIDASAAKLSRLRSQGVRLALDDFGTGYSALGYLQRFSLDTLKIDRTFVRDLETNANAVSMSEAIIAMAHGFGLTTVAEGVESEAQKRILLNLGCEQMQGFLFSPAVTAERFCELMSTQCPQECDESCLVH